MRRWFCSVLVLVACGDDDNAPKNPELTFPKGFLWGAAVAGFQSDPGCPTMPPEQCEDRASDWYQWVTDPEIIAEPANFVTGEPLAHGPGMREVYAADLQRAKDLGVKGIRLSIEWSRLFPDGAAESATSVDELAAHVDDEELAFYHAMFAEVRRLGLVPLVTLNHYTLPLWIHDGKACHEDLDGCEDRGWVDRERIVKAIALYAGFCAREFGGEVDLWATLNEPVSATTVAGYVLPSSERTHPPGVQFRFDMAIAVINNQIYGHAAMVDAVRAEDHADADRDGVDRRIGTVVSIAPARPEDTDDPRGPDSARHANWVVNEIFLEGTANGRLDENLDGVLEDPKPELVGRLDWIGINYYTPIYVTATPAPLAPGFAWTDFVPSLGEGLIQVDPEGMYQAVALANRFGRPMIITENGSYELTETSGDTFLLPHLRTLHRAIDEGMPVEGYFVWTLVDNYEWNHGMSMKLGMYALDIDTKARTLRPIGERYREVVRANGF